MKPHIEPLLTPAEVATLGGHHRYREAEVHTLLHDPQAQAA
ncbi:hypothetical protein GCM10017673_38930 [Streptosporangium violaceochromogenes]|nr:hypothetical protein GCM10017673_38930 [Streptosporangium violaceochromogenes]